jgi:Uma2 family endonuclease
MIFPTLVKGSYIERMTDEEFFRFCQDNRDVKFERTSTGQIIIMSPTTYLTGKRNNRILFQLNLWNEKYKLGDTVDSDTGFYLANGAMRNPDAAWISKEKLATVPKAELDSFPHLCPEFIIELKSKSDSLSELKNKMQEWMDNCCQLGWLVDADNEVVYIYESDKEIRTHSDFNTPLTGSPLLPGFELILSELRV